MSFLAEQYEVRDAFGLTASGLFFALSSFIVGVALLVVYGIPVYLLLLKRGKATLLNVLAAASIPPFSAALLTTWEGSILLFCFALPIAFAMHIWHEKTQSHA